MIQMQGREYGCHVMSSDLDENLPTSNQVRMRMLHHGTVAVLLSTPNVLKTTHATIEIRQKPVGIVQYKSSLTNIKLETKLPSRPDLRKKDLRYAAHTANRYSTMAKRNFRITPSHIIGFAISSLATDYFIYRQNFHDFNSVIWRRVLGDNTGTIGKPGGDQ